MDNGSSILDKREQISQLQRELENDVIKQGKKKKKKERK